MIGERIETNIAGGLNFELPRMVNIRQKLPNQRLSSVTEAINGQFARAEIRAKVKRGAKIAVGCGSRGVANIAEAAKAVVAQIKALGGEPFIFPAMGSHGGATVEGQLGVLTGYGITEAYVGCPIRATMETVRIGQTPGGVPVHIDRFAHEADGIVLINRIKPHTDFRAPIESGIVKMICIGMGKLDGATTLHANGMDQFERVLPEVARVVIDQRKFLFGVGMIENAHDETAIVEAISAEQLFVRETELQAQAKKMIGRLLFDEIDVLVIDEIGKNISGAGADPNVTGRNNAPGWDQKPKLSRIVMLGLTKESKGNATGMGNADIITMRFYKDIDVGPTYANVITAAELKAAAIPLIMNTDRDAIALAVKTTLRVKPADARIIRIQNTLRVTDIQVSEPLLSYVKANPDKFDVLSDPTPLRFDAGGRIAPI